MPPEGNKGSANLHGQEFDPLQEYGGQFAPEVKNVIRLTLAFAKAVGVNQDDGAKIACLKAVFG